MSTINEAIESATGITNLAQVPEEIRPFVQRAIDTLISREASLRESFTNEGVRLGASREQLGQLFDDYGFGPVTRSEEPVSTGEVFQAEVSQPSGVAYAIDLLEQGVRELRAAL
jgi:hypothetical protein